MGCGDAGGVQTAALVRESVLVSDRLAGWEESALAAAHLTASLRSGWRPPAIDVPIHLLPGETAIASHPVEISRHCGQQVQWSPGAFLAFGNPLWTGLSVAGTVAYNVTRRRRAEEQARTQWRFADRGLMYMTTQRIACQLHEVWLDLPYHSVRASGPVPDGLVIWLDGQSPAKLHLPYPDWYYVLFRHLAHGEIVGPTLPEDLRRRIRAAGKPLPPDDPCLPETAGTT